MRTEKMYENCIVELEWRHMKEGGNAGLFLWGDGVAAPGIPFTRGIEVQILDNAYNAKGKNEWFTTHGDIFPIHGAKMTPAGKVAFEWCSELPIGRIVQELAGMEPLSRRCQRWRDPSQRQRKGSVRRKELLASQRLYLPRVRRFRVPFSQPSHPRTPSTNATETETAVSGEGTSFLSSPASTWTTGKSQKETMVTGRSLAKYWTTMAKAKPRGRNLFGHNANTKTFN